MPVPYTLWEPRAARDGAVAVTTSPEGCTSAAAGLGWAGYDEPGPLAGVSAAPPLPGSKMAAAQGLCPL